MEETNATELTSPHLKRPPYPTTSTHPHLQLYIPSRNPGHQRGKQKADEKRKVTPSICSAMSERAVNERKKGCKRKPNQTQATKKTNARNPREQNTVINSHPTPPPPISASAPGERRTKKSKASQARQKRGRSPGCFCKTERLGERRREEIPPEDEKKNRSRMMGGGDPSTRGK